MGFKTENHEDMTLFKNRLWKLMEKKGIDSAAGLARELSKKNLVKVNFRETEEIFTDKDIAQKKIWAIERKVKIHLNSETAECLKGDFVLAYCKFFECSADYLFGKIECSTHEKQICHNLTGLSEDAIEILEEDKNSYFPYALTAINFLLQKDDYIDDKRELFHLILQYILLSQNIKSYYECGISKMENKDIVLCDEYGTPTGSASVDKMSNIFLLSINEILNKLKANISKTQECKKPDMIKILSEMLFDFLRMEEIKNNLNGLNFDIDNLSVMNRRFKENNKRLVYLFHCNSIDDIDFDAFKAIYPQYSNEIENLKKVLVFY